jgi:hypothetical protein
MSSKKPLEYWFIGDTLAGISAPLRPSIHFTFNKVFVCNRCGESWAKRIRDGEGLPIYWMADSQSSCPSCPPPTRRTLKMITYEEEFLNEYSNVPTSLLAYEFLWLSLAEKI